MPVPDVVRVVPYNPRWREFFEIERVRVGAVAGEWIEVVEHVGSTSVPGLDEKPVVDMMAGVRSLRYGGRCVRLLKGLGFEHRGEARVPGRMFLRKASPRVFHLNLAVVGGEFWEHHLLFRDYLGAHPETAREYARLKHALASRFRYDRGAYTQSKTGFVEGVFERAAAERRFYSVSPKNRPTVPRSLEHPMSGRRRTQRRRDFPEDHSFRELL